MNCCDYECNQGRDCPARASKVARVGARLHGPEPLHGLTWRDYLPEFAKYMLVSVLMTLMCVALVVGVLV